MKWVGLFAQHKSVAERRRTPWGFRSSYEQSELEILMPHFSSGRRPGENWPNPLGGAICSGVAPYIYGHHGPGEAKDLYFSTYRRTVQTKAEWLQVKGETLRGEPLTGCTCSANTPEGRAFLTHHSR